MIKRNFIEFCSDSFLSLSSALTVLKQEIPSPFGNDQVKKLVKSAALNKEQANDIEQATGANVKSGNNSGSAVTAAAGDNNTNPVSNANNITCHLNGNSNSSASNDFGNCLDNINQNQQQSNQNDANDELGDSNNLSTIIKHSTYSFRQIAFDEHETNLRQIPNFHFTEVNNGQTRDEKSTEESK